MKELFERLENSEEFKKFKQEYPDAYFCTAFFILGKAEEEKQQLNYTISDSEVMSFDISKEKISPVKLKTIKNELLEEIKKEDIRITPEEAKSNVEKHAKKKFNKSIIVLQRINGKTVWNVTCIEGFSITRFHVSANDGKIQDLKSFNIQDMMKSEKKNTETGKREEVKLQEKPSEKSTPAKENKAVPAKENQVRTNETSASAEEPKQTTSNN